jgi:hypothetical protein
VARSEPPAKERVIIVHTIEQVRDALAAASELQTPVTLQSAPDAIFYAGSLYLLCMYEEAHEEFPDVTAHFILDCGDGGAEAIAAVHAGHRHLRLHAPEEIRARLEGIAHKQGVMIYDGDYEALDLATAGDTKSACIQWLKR